MAEREKLFSIYDEMLQQCGWWRPKHEYSFIVCTNIINTIIKEANKFANKRTGKEKQRKSPRSLHGISNELNVKEMMMNKKTNKKKKKKSTHHWLLCLWWSSTHHQLLNTWLVIFLSFSLFLSHPTVYDWCLISNHPMFANSNNNRWIYFQVETTKICCELTKNSLQTIQNLCLTNPSHNFLFTMFRLALSLSRAPVSAHITQEWNEQEAWRGVAHCNSISLFTCSTILI